MSHRAASVALIALLVVACGGGIYMRAIATKTVKPARVVVLFSAEGANGPIGDLTRDNFKLTEDGRDVPDTGDWQLTKPDLRAHHRALLLLDLGGRITPADRTAVANAARIFVDRMRGVGRVAVYVYDGDAEPHLITPFSEDVPQEDLAKLDSFEAKDVSTDLYSSYKGAYEALAVELRKDALGVGAVVVVSRGPDRASRLSSADVQQYLDKSDIQVPRHAVGVSETAREAGLEDLSTDEPKYVKTADLGKALYELATKLRTQSTSYYLLSYCSQARAGEHELTIEAKRTTKDEEGKPLDEWGSLSHSFSAKDFGAGCDPNKTDQGGGGGGAGGSGGAPATSASIPVPKAPAPAPKASGPTPALPVPEPGGSGK